MIAQRLAAPLCHPVGTLHLAPVTILSQDWLAHIGTGKKVGKEFVYNDGDRIIDVSLRNPFVIECGRRSDGKVISFIPVPYRYWSFGVRVKNY